MDGSKSLQYTRRDLIRNISQLGLGLGLIELLKYTNTVLAQSETSLALHGWETPIPTTQITSTESLIGIKDEWYMRMLQAQSVLSLATSVTVAGVDTGNTISNHPLMNGAIFLPGGNYSGTNPDDYTYTVDDSGHGTNALSIVHMVSGAKMVPIKVFGERNAVSSTDNVAQGIKDARLKFNADIVFINFTGASGSIFNAINTITDDGAIVVASAGNSSLQRLENPAALAETNRFVIPACSLHYDGNPTYFTCNPGGVLQSAWAPGVFIHSVNKNGELVYFNGTSASTPLVSGVLAVIWQYVKQPRPGVNLDKFQQRDLVLRMFDQYRQEVDFSEQYQQSLGIPQLQSSAFSTQNLYAMLPDIQR